ncbi:MAG: hypothetical protein WC648_04710 [Candidatus Paceibacterota bacterium]|jgi:hypothetical protein
MNTSVTELMVIDPKEFVAQSYQSFTESLDAAIIKAPSLTYEISTTKGMEVAKEGRAMFRDIRIALEKKRASAKAPILEIGKLLDSRAKEIAQIIEPFEEKFDSDIKAEEARKEAEKAANAKAESDRQDNLQRAIDHIRNAPTRAASLGVVEIENIIKDLKAIAFEITKGHFQERTEEANFVMAETMTALESLLEGKKAQEQLAAQVEAQRIENERVAKELSAKQAEEEDRQRETLKAEAERQRAQAAELDKQRAELAAQQKIIDDHRAKIQAEEEAKARAKVEAEQRTKLENEIKEEAETLKKYEKTENLGESIPVVKQSLTTEPAKVVGICKPSRPAHAELIQFVANNFNVSYGQACDWVLETAEHLNERLKLNIGKDN